MRGFGEAREERIFEKCLRRWSNRVYVYYREYWEVGFGRLEKGLVMGLAS